MHLLALDFDGVLCDSSREVFVVAADAWTAREPRSALGEQLLPLREDAFGGGRMFRTDPLYLRFRDLLPLGNRAEDFGVALRAIEDQADIVDQEAYDAFYRGLPPDWIEAFHHAFYLARARLRDSDPGGWLELHLPYPGLGDLLRRRAVATRMAVATAKDRLSVKLLLEALGYDEVFEASLILDKETGVAKTHHLAALRERTGIAYRDITFVDDKLNHLVRVAELGVRPVLAGWGFNTGREHARALELGFEVAELESAEAVLFKGE
jgi:phosphoglycolate phosphatase-like HAD superfamily hydrolase